MTKRFVNRASLIRPVLIVVSLAVSIGEVRAAPSGLSEFVVAASPATTAQKNPARRFRRERERAIDVLHYRIELSFVESAKAMRGTTTIRFRSLRSDLAGIELDAETFSVDRVSDLSGEPLAFVQENGALRIDLPGVLRFGEEISVVVDYSGYNVDVDPEAYGMDKGYDLGLDFKSETEKHPQLINTLSFPEGARHWFPCYDHPNDRASQETLVTIRDDYKVLSNGRLLDRRPSGEPGRTLWHWSQELAHPTYLFVLVAGPYEVIEDRFGDLPVNYWVYPRDKDDARRSFHKTPEILEFFTNEFGFDYPWAKYDQITIPGIGGGAESTSATVVGESTIHDARADQDFPSHWLVAHEAAHQWWGNVVSYRDWGETWLSESFATYGEYLWSLEDMGADEAAVNLLGKKDAYFTEASTRYRRPIVSHDWERPNENFDRHTYQKGAVVLNMLRWRLGDSAFRAVLSEFLNTYAFQPVDTHDFMRTIKDVTGRNFDAFFEQWIFSPGHPIFRVETDFRSKTLSLKVTQVQDREDGTPNYETPVLIGIHTGGKHETHRIEIRKAEETFDFDVPSRPDLVRFDEGNYLLKELQYEKSVDELVYQAQHDDVIGQMWAIARLGETSADAAIHALRDLATSARFWSVRRDAVIALNGNAPRSLLNQTAVDSNSNVRAATLSVLGESHDPELAAFYRERFEADDSYLVQAEAVQALGKLRRTEDRSFFERVRSMDSPRQVLRRAAEEALKSSKQ